MSVTSELSSIFSGMDTPRGSLRGVPGDAGSVRSLQYDAASLSRMSDTDLLHAELRMMFASKPRLAIPRTPDAPLDQASSKEDVTDWLKVKGFNDDVVKRLAGLTGNTLLNLKKTDLNKLLGTNVEECEIKRLDSQIKKQRATNPFNTTRTSEFNAVLARARRKAEEALAVNDQDVPSIDNGASAC